MSAVTQLEAAAIYNALTAGTALAALVPGTAIYYQQAPEGKALPYLVFSLQSGMVENINPSDLHNDLWYVRGYAASPSAAAAIDTAADALLDKKTLTVSGYTNFWTARETDISMVENAPTGSIYTQGAIYRFRLDK